MAGKLFSNNLYSLKGVTGLVNNRQEVKAISERLEPLENVENKGKIDDIYSQSPILLAQWDDFRTLRWIDSVKCPELLMKQIRGLLQLTAF